MYSQTLKNKAYILAICSMLLFPSAGHAEKPVEPIKRISIENGLGMALFYGHTRIAYRLPALEDRLDIFFDYNWLEAEYTDFPGRQQLLTGGVRYYTGDLSAPFQTYLSAAVGTSFQLREGNELTRNTSLLHSPFSVWGAIGADYFFTPNLGINMQLGFGVGAPTENKTPSETNISLPQQPFFLAAPRGEINLKLSF